MTASTGEIGSEGCSEGFSQAIENVLFHREERQDLQQIIYTFPMPHSRA